MLKISNDEIKVIVSDLDGTLRPTHSTHENEKVEKSINALKTAVKNGAYFVLNTGNLPGEMRDFAEWLGEINNRTTYVIASNGNVIQNYLKDEVVIVDQMFEQKDLFQFVNFFQMIGGLSYDFASADLKTIYFNDPNIKDQMIKIRSKSKYPIARLDLTEEVLNHFGQCARISVKRVPLAKKQKIIELVPKYFQNLDLEVSWFMNDGVDFQIKGANKYQGIVKLLEILNQENNLNLTLNNVIYFGDHMNDLDVFKNLKYSIAVANAIDEVKELAYDVTSSAADGGIGDYLEKITQKETTNVKNKSRWN